MARNINLQQLSTSIIFSLTAERDKITNDSFKDDSSDPRPALFILLLYSAHEHFLNIAFKKLLKNSSIREDAKEILEGKTGNFSLKSDYPTFCSFLLPDLYEKSEVRNKFIVLRNAYAHRIFNSSGIYTFIDDDKYTIGVEQLNSYFEYSKRNMGKIGEEIERRIHDGITTNI